MVKNVLFAAALAAAPGLTSARAQVPDTAALRPTFDAVRALFDRYEREHGHFVTVGALRVHYLEWGSRTGTPLIWLHGSASTGYELRRVAPKLAEAGYRVIAMDYRGHGQTRVDNYDFTIWDVADDVVGLMDRLGLRTAVVGGASKGGFIAAAVYDQYKTRVSGLLLADGGSWSNQWIFDHHGLDGAKREVAGAPPVLLGGSAIEVMAKLVGGPVPAGTDPERLLDPFVAISRRADGQWTFLDGFDRLMGSPASYLAGATAPSTMPLLQWSQHAMLPLAVFRKVAIPVMILDPDEVNDNLPVTDQNERLTALHPKYIVHRRYPDTGHAVVRLRPEWFVRDAKALLEWIRTGRQPGPVSSS